MAAKAGASLDMAPANGYSPIDVQSIGSFRAGKVLCEHLSGIVSREHRTRLRKCAGAGVRGGRLPRMTFFSRNDSRVPRRDRGAVVRRGERRITVLGTWPRIDG